MQSINYEFKKRKTTFLFLSLRRNILPILFCMFTIFLVIFSKNNLIATKEGLSLWANNVVPSLLPFFIATELLGYTNVISKLGRLLHPIMKPLFNIPGIGSYAFLMGIISGYPTGAKIVVNLKEEGLCTTEEAERMIAFTNNSGPLFIMGTVGVSMFGNTLIGILLFITHLLACLSVGILFRFWKKNKTSSVFTFSNKSKPPKEQVNFRNLGDILGRSIVSAIQTVVFIGGFIVLFSVILSILKHSGIISLISSCLSPLFRIFGIENIKFSTSFVCGILELTNGIMQVASIPCKQLSINLILASFLLGFGGFSVLLQVYSIIAKSNISIKAYFIGKLLHGIFAACYTFIFITYFPIFNLNL